MTMEVVEVPPRVTRILYFAFAVEMSWLELNRIAMIPRRYWHVHEYCFYLHDQTVELLRQYESSGVQNAVRDAFVDQVKENGLQDHSTTEMLAFLKEKNLHLYYKHHLISHLTLALTSDMLHFIYEALSSFEKRKFSVGFALLRKPLKENLLFLSWLLANPDEFIEKFEKDPAVALNNLKSEGRISIIAGAIEKLATDEAFDAHLIHDIIYAKGCENGLEPIWQRAMHLITSHGALMKTEDMSLNFIFNNPAADDLFDIIYARLPYLLIYQVQVCLECFSQIWEANEQTVSHLILTTIGYYENILTNGNRPVTNLFKKQLKGLLSCIHCDASYKLNRPNARNLFLNEHLRCDQCGVESAFPLYWLMAKANFSIVRKHERPSILGKISI